MIVAEKKWIFLTMLLTVFNCMSVVIAQHSPNSTNKILSRERISINEGWFFMRYNSDAVADTLIYDERPKIERHNDNIVADTRAEQEGYISSSQRALKKWILPSANNFIKNPSLHHIRPSGNPGQHFAYVQQGFNDATWQKVNLPHDWAMQGPFYKDPNPVVGGGMGRLPSQGVAWYRKKLDIPANDAGKIIYLDVDGAMSYAMVWLNGHLVGGWPYGYNSFRLNLTPYLNFGGVNQLAIRVDNPNHSSRWYTGGGLYRNVWLVKTQPVHIGQWGTFITTPEVSTRSARVNLSVDVENQSTIAQKAQLITDVYELDKSYKRSGKVVVRFPNKTIEIPAGQKNNVTNGVVLQNPKLWNPLPEQYPHMYVAVTRVFVNGVQVDDYETPFGVRSVQMDPEKGVIVNGVPVRIKGVNQHHDLGALGAAYNHRAAERQLEILKEAGCNAIRISHNPPAAELLDLTDKMGFLVINEIFDCWEKGKTPLDFHLIFKDWYEPDTRAFIRRDRNHPSVIAWSFGNEVGEQYTGNEGATVAKKLHDIIKEEDVTRPTTASMNFAKPDMPFPQQMDMISLNYQGEGIRDAPAYQHLNGIKTSPLYPAFHSKFPEKLIVSSETASALSTRGTYLFPVVKGNSAPVSDSTGGNGKLQQVSAYELYTAPFGASADKVFASQDKHPYVAGEFVWSGWDYLGEPTPYYTARSSYSGIIDLAGFKKARFYLYQSRWLPEKPMVYILPHWNWPGRVGVVTPVHVFTSGDEAELFLNGRSLGKKKKQQLEYRLRWDDVLYESGEVKVIAYKNGKKWAEQTVTTTGNAAALQITADRKTIKADGNDLSFITVAVTDNKGLTVPDAAHNITFSIEGPGEIVATDNGDPADLVAFPSKERKAYSGLALIIVKGVKGQPGAIKITASAQGLSKNVLIINSK